MPGPMQWTPGGMVSLSDAAATPVAEGGFPAFVPANPLMFAAAAEDDHDEPAPRPKAAKATAATRKPVAAFSPKDAIKLARARLREIKAELRRMRSLEKERATLERLLGAADEKPRAIVRSLKTETRHGA